MKSSSSPVLLVLLAFLLGTCQPTPSSLKNAQTVSSSVSQIISPAPTVTANSFSLNQVLPNLQNPNSILDLFGEGTLGTFCASSTSTGSNYCACTYSYQLPTGGQQQIEFPILYQEENLVRCDYSHVPSGVSSFQVSIHLTTADIYTNAISFTPQSSSSGLSTQNIQNFSKVYRYQCHDIVSIPYLLGGSVPDPILSNDPQLSYPLNFYSTQLSQSLSQFVQSLQPRWQCPSLLNPEEFLTGSASLADFYQDNGINPYLYSTLPLVANNDYLISPKQLGSPDRTTFFLLKQPSGVFTVPVNAFVAPNLPTQEGSATLPPLGYGATPTASENCPSVPLPNGYQWVKVWLFRASLPPRKYPQSTLLPQAGPVVCNPGTWQDSTGNVVPVFPGCDTNSIHLNNLSASSIPFVDRILGTGQCLGNTSYLGADGGDIWKKRNPSSTNDPCLNTSVNGNLIQTCQKITQFPPTFSSLQHPWVQDLSYGTLDTVSRFDFLFVVSPPNVTQNDIRSATSLGKQYIPVRFLTASNCLSENPTLCQCAQSPDLSMCRSASLINSYQYKASDISVTSNATTNPLFPLCAIQAITPGF